MRALEELNATLETSITEHSPQQTEAQPFLISLLNSLPGMVYRWSALKRLGLRSQLEG